jgi:predicted lysophospholipase L1 biosynthesis ABC-type transport system permease subunit
VPRCLGWNGLGGRCHNAVVNRRGGPLALCIALGAGVGTAIGVSMRNLAVWIAIGVAIGVALGLALENRARR